MQVGDEVGNLDAGVWQQLAQRLVAILRFRAENDPAEVCALSVFLYLPLIGAVDFFLLVL